MHSSPLSLLLLLPFWLAIVGTLSYADITTTVQTLNRSSQDDFKEWDHYRGIQPNGDHLHVRGGGAGPHSCW